MTLKKPFTITSIEDQSAPQIEENFSRVYRDKVEGRVHTRHLNGTATVSIQTFQAVETGVIQSNNLGGSATWSASVPLQDSGTILTALISVIAPNAIELPRAVIKDVTNSSLFITVQSQSGTLSAVHSSITVTYAVFRSNP